MTTESTTLLVIGAGPCGLAVGVAARQAGMPCVLLDRRNIVSTIDRYPLAMTFFSTPERIEIGGVPFVASHEKPTRRDGLIYYRRVAEHYALDVRPAEEVVDVTRDGSGRYRLLVQRPHDETSYLAENVAFATGYFDNPNFLGVPGEELPHVSHYFREGHPFWHRQVVVIGAGNSAVDAALECWRAGAEVTIVHLGEKLDATVKPWVLPDITNRIREGSIGVRWRSRVRAITPTHVAIMTEGVSEVEELGADAVLAMTGYHADTMLLQRLGVPVDGASGIPAHDERTMSTPLPGCYLAGVIASGNDANRLFIENSRGHGERIVRDIIERQGAAARQAAAVG
ncbi:MAG TPA: YpdA family putative bacillithiol disulfide reductase [Gemmatimonadales bacterium]|nr:YpdA family putative bacillithiol disulfide reductase [Gemmatimonadales bacterium]